MAPEMHREENSELLTGSESVLLVDDEEMVLNVSKELLESLGYQVITAGGGREAIEIFETKADAIDLVILDFTMPEMSCEETFSRLKMIAPRVPVLVSSGFSLNEHVRQILDQDGTGFIQKPFRLYMLSRKVREMLDS